VVLPVVLPVVPVEPVVPVVPVEALPRLLDPLRLLPEGESVRRQLVDYL
jgi:hypothetical protein